MKKTLWQFLAIIMVVLSIGAVKVKAGTSPPKMWIDAPINNANIVKTAEISGWALNSSGVKQVNIYIDASNIGQALLGITRNDVNAIFPGYPNGDKSGFSYSLDINTVSVGRHTLKVEAIGNDNTKTEMTQSLNVAKAEARIWIDEPSNNVTVQNNINISGWSLNPSGVKLVDVYVDSTFSGHATIGISRPDVNSAFPGYINGDKSGFSYLLNINNITKGTHRISIQAVGNDGGVKEKLLTINVNKPESKIWIDEPSSNAIIQSSLNVSGWSLNPSGIKAVDIYIDGNLNGSATIGISRPDVNSAFPGYLNGDKSGFSYFIDINKISNGNHNIKIQAVGNDSSIIERQIPVNVKKPESKIWLDQPGNNSNNYNSNFSISGWSLNPSGIKMVDIYIDGRFVDHAITGILRSDVNNAFPGYLNGDKSGFCYNVDINTILPGKHNILVQAVGNDGNIKETSALINVIKPEAKMWIDNPTNNGLILGNINIDGWALNASGVSCVNVSVDGNNIGRATIGVSRDDVNRAFPGYRGGSNSGFCFSLDISQYTPGFHTIKVQAIGVDGTSKEISLQVNFYGIVSHEIYNITLDSYVAKEFSNSNPLYITGSKPTTDELKNILNPNGKLTTDDKFQFMRLDKYYDGMSVGDLTTYLQAKDRSASGVFKNNAQAFIDAAKMYNINVMYLVAHAMLETGYGSSSLAQGYVVSQIDGTNLAMPRKIYNFFGIGAVDSSPNPSGAKLAYNNGWFDPVSAIKGGASWIAKYYIQSTYNPSMKKQNSLYDMRWNYDSNYSDGSIWHQYATDALWAQKVSNIIANQIYGFYHGSCLEFQIIDYNQ